MSETKVLKSSKLNWEELDSCKTSMPENSITNEELEGSTVLYYIELDDTYRPNVRDQVRQLKSGAVVVLDSLDGLDYLYETDEAKEQLFRILDEGVEQ